MEEVGEEEAVLLEEFPHEGEPQPFARYFQRSAQSVGEPRINFCEVITAISAIFIVIPAMVTIFKQESIDGAELMLNDTCGSNVDFDSGGAKTFIGYLVASTISSNALLGIFAFCGITEFWYFLKRSTEERYLRTGSESVNCKNLLPTIGFSICNLVMSLAITAAFGYFIVKGDEEEETSLTSWDYFFITLASIVTFIIAWLSDNLLKNAIVDYCSKLQHSWWRLARAILPADSEYRKYVIGQLTLLELREGIGGMLRDARLNLPKLSQAQRDHLIRELPYLFRSTVAPSETFIDLIKNDLVPLKRDISPTRVWSYFKTPLYYVGLGVTWGFIGGFVYSLLGYADASQKGASEFCEAVLHLPSIIVNGVGIIGRIAAFFSFSGQTVFALLDLFQGFWERLTRGKSIVERVNWKTFYVLAGINAFAAAGSGAMGYVTNIKYSKLMRWLAYISSLVNGPFGQKVIGTFILSVSLTCILMKIYCCSENRRERLHNRGRLLNTIELFKHWIEIFNKMPLRVVAELFKDNSVFDDWQELLTHFKYYLDQEGLKNAVYSIENLSRAGITKFGQTGEPEPRGNADETHFEHYDISSDASAGPPQPA